MKQIRSRLYKIKEALKERRIKYIFSKPINIFYLIVLLARSLLLRLIPRVTIMYFIRKDFTSYPIEIGKTGYEFKIFSHYSEEIKTFIVNRCSEDPVSIFDAYSKVIANRLNKGLKAYTLLHNGVIVSIFFISDQDYLVDQVNYIYKPEKNEILISDIYTLMNYRKTGLYSLLLKHTIMYYRNEDITTFVMWIMKHNRATIWAQLKMGFVEIFMTITLFSWLGINKSSIDTTKSPLNSL